jgi:hypothetical protein
VCSGTQRLQITEELRVGSGDPHYVRHMQRCQKLGRTLGVANIQVAHKVNDAAAQADDGTAESKIAAGLLADTANKIVLHQAPDQLPSAEQALASPAESAAGSASSPKAERSGLSANTARSSTTTSSTRNVTSSTPTSACATTATISPQPNRRTTAFTDPPANPIAPTPVSTLPSPPAGVPSPPIGSSSWTAAAPPMSQPEVDRWGERRPRPRPDLARPLSLPQTASLIPLPRRAVNQCPAAASTQSDAG